MLKICVILFFLNSVAFGVLLRDPKKFPCDDYDLFDPPVHILSESDGSSPNHQENHEALAHHVVDQLNARTNSVFKSLLLQLKDTKSTLNGYRKLAFFQVETQCRNNGKKVTSLIKCPFRQQGKVQECSATVNVSAGITIDQVTCRPSSFAQVLRLPADGSLEDLSNVMSTVWSAIALVGFRNPTTDNFKCFRLRFNKNYADNQEHQQRFAQFQQNMKRAYLYQITEQGTGVYGPTKFSDLTVQEFKRLATGLKPTGNMFTGMNNAGIPDISTDDLPDAFDWRNKSAVTPVKDQGQCGSCWAFSTTGNIEGQWAIKRGKLVSLSEQELVDCDKLDEGCGGGLPSNAYKSIIELGGLELESDYPYDGRDDKCSYKKQKAKVYINDSVVISQNETEMAQWLVKNGPISIGINANAMMLYMGGVSHPWKVVCSPKSLDHGVLIVGYGQQGKNPFWIVKNSWGPGWGVKGYYLVYRGDGTCGLNLMCTSAVVADPK